MDLNLAAKGRSMPWQELLWPEQTALPLHHRPQRSSYIATARQKIRSLWHRLVYGSVIKGQQNEQQTATLFRRSLVGWILCIYLPMMALSYLLVKHNSTSIGTGKLLNQLNNITNSTVRDNSTRINNLEAILKLNTTSAI